MNNEGWIKFPRKYYKEKIAHQPPHFREIFVFLVVNANHKPGRSSGITIDRGQLFTSYSDIRDALHWYVGARKERYSKTQVESAMKWLRKEGLIQTTKTTRGLLITICKYDSYQNENSLKPTTKPIPKPTGNLRTSHTINKNGRIKERSVTCDPAKIPFGEFWDAYDKKVGPKSRIERKWNQLSLGEQQAVMDYIPHYKNSTPEKKYRKNPETFLNNRGWEDELIGSSKKPIETTTNDGIRQEDYDIPHGDLFGYTKEELQERIETGKYQKKCR